MIKYRRHHYLAVDLITGIQYYLFEEAVRRLDKKFNYKIQREPILVDSNLVYPKEEKRQGKLDVTNRQWIFPDYMNITEDIPDLYWEKAYTNYMLTNL